MNNAPAGNWAMPLLVASLLGAAACAAEPARSVNTVVRDSSGIEIVEHTGPPRDSAGWTVARVLSIGATDSPDTVYQFARVYGVVRLANGSVVVANNSEARWFDSTGTYTRSGTRQGNGPGEIAYDIIALTRMVGDSVAATEMRGGQIKYVVLSPTGDYVREHRVDGQKFAALGQWGECRVTVLTDLSQVRCLRSVEDGARAPNPGPGLLRRHYRLAHVPATLDVRHELGYDIGLEQFGLTIGPRTHFVVHPFHARSHIAAGGAPPRIAIVTNPDYAIEVWTPGGRLERIIRRTDGRRRPTDAEVAWARAQLTTYARRYEPQVIDQIVNGIPTPDSLPAATGLVVGAHGEVLLKRFHTDSSVYDVYDSGGAYLAELRLPARFTVFQVDGNYVTGVRFTDDDVPLVEVYRVARENASRSPAQSSPSP
jgi:hypothetical protein